MKTEIKFGPAQIVRAALGKHWHGQSHLERAILFEIIVGQGAASTVVEQQRSHLKNVAGGAVGYSVRNKQQSARSEISSTTTGVLFGNVVGKMGSTL